MPVIGAETAGAFVAALTVDTPSGVAAGDLLVAWLTANDQPSHDPPAGWDLEDSAVITGGTTVWVYTRRAQGAPGGGEPTSYTWSFSVAHQHDVIVTAARGAEGIRDLAIATNASTSSLNMPSLAAEQGDLLLGCGMHWSGTAGTQPVIGGMSEVATSRTYSSVYEEDADEGATTAHAVTSTIDGRMAAAAVLLEPTPQEAPIPVWQNTFDGTILGPRDDFARTESSTWGTASDGTVWTEEGGAAGDRAMTPGAATITLQSAPATVRHQVAGTASIPHCEALIAVRPGQVSAGGSIFPGVLFRWQSSSSYYRVRLGLLIGGGIDIQALHVSTGPSESTGLTYSAGTLIWMRARIQGTRMFGRAWLDGSPEPDEWQIDHQPSTALGAGRVGIVTSASGANSNSNPVLSYEHWAVSRQEVLTPANLADTGDAGAAPTSTTNLHYTSADAAHGSASAEIGRIDGGVGASTTMSTASGLGVGSVWAYRSYVRVPTDGYLQADDPAGSGWVFLLDDDGDILELIDQDVSAHAANLLDRWIRIEAICTGSARTARVWWTDPHSAGPHDLQVSSGPDTLNQCRFAGGGTGAPPSLLDEVVISDEAEWIGPAGEIHTGGAAGALEVSVTASGRKVARGQATVNLGVTALAVGTAGTMARIRLQAAVTASGRKVARGGAAAELDLAAAASARKVLRGQAVASLVASVRADSHREDIPGLDGQARVTGRIGGTARPAGRVGGTARRA